MVAPQHRQGLEAPHIPRRAGGEEQPGSGKPSWTLGRNLLTTQGTSLLGWVTALIPISAWGASAAHFTRAPFSASIARGVCDQSKALGNAEAFSRRR